MCILATLDLDSCKMIFQGSVVAAPSEEPCDGWVTRVFPPPPPHPPSTWFSCGTWLACEEFATPELNELLSTYSPDPKISFIPHCRQDLAQSLQPSVGTAAFPPHLCGSPPVRQPSAPYSWSPLPCLCSCWFPCPEKPASSLLRPQHPVPLLHAQQPCHHLNC